jgi:hypothetical protein
MRFAEYVAAGWTITGVAFAAYWLVLVRRLRRAERSWPNGEATD